MKIWQLLAIVSGSIISVVMAAASISYTATLASPDPAFAWFPVSNMHIFSVLALAFDLGMIASVFGALHWWSRNRIGAVACIALFVIASLFSIHSVRGYIALNLTKTAAPMQRSEELYASLKLELNQAQNHLGQLLLSYKSANRSDRRRLDRQITAARGVVRDARKALLGTRVPARVSPLAGLEWFLAVTLWFFNATCWCAWFGYRPPGGYQPPDTVAAWLLVHPQSEPQHCAALFEAYATWCETHGRAPLAQYNFYARLIELGARKFRDGRNGPTMYALPEQNA
ncbi:MAG: hypothetical protein JXQ99_00455 [Hyphomicrobiaceae bacterium]